jgi:tRNA A-37 threonylcarbamoyl transferase component Bud32
MFINHKILNNYNLGGDIGQNIGRMLVDDVIQWDVTVSTMI